MKLWNLCRSEKNKHNNEKKIKMTLKKWFFAHFFGPSILELNCVLMVLNNETLITEKLK